MRGLEDLLFFCFYVCAGDESGNIAEYLLAIIVII